MDINKILIDLERRMGVVEQLLVEVRNDFYKKKIVKKAQETKVKESPVKGKKKTKKK